MNAGVLAHFNERGYLKVEAAIGRHEAQQMANSIWQWLEQTHGIEREKPLPGTTVRITGFQVLTKSGVFGAMASSVVKATIDSILGFQSWVSPRHWGAPLINLPTAERPWDIPVSGWHLDFPARGAVEPLCGVRIIALLEDVAPQGGSTLVLAGSNRLVLKFMAENPGDPGNSTRVREWLAECYSWLKDLFAERHTSNAVEAFMERGTTLDGVPLRVVELTGAAGDVFFMHPWTIHAGSPNTGAHARMAVSQSVVRAGTDVFLKNI